MKRQLKDYIKQCVEIYKEEQLPGRDSWPPLLVDRLERFVQMGGLICIPNSKEDSYNGCMLRTTDIVEGWDDDIDWDDIKWDGPIEVIDCKK